MTLPIDFKVFYMYVIVINAESEPIWWAQLLLEEGARPSI